MESLSASAVSREFTFHYVSIKSYMAEYNAYLTYDLHSTMFLLNPLPAAQAALTG